MKLNKLDWFMVVVTFATVIALIALSGCGADNTVTLEPAPVEQPPQNPIVTTDLEMGYGAHGYWSFNNNSTMPYATESVSSKVAWGTGRIKFKIRGLDYNKLTSSDTFIFMAKLKAPNGDEGNFHYNIADKVPRLITQRFDGTCSPFCEHQAHGSVNWNPAETYAFEFAWDYTTVYMVVKDSSGNTVHSASVTSDGSYTGVDWIRVGNGVMTAYGWANTDMVVINPYLE